MHRIYRRRSRSALATIIVAPNSAVAGPVRQANDLGSWAKRQHQELTAVRDAEALQKLADGHTDAFIQYANKRLSVATDDEDRAYWQRLIERSKQKVADDTIAAGVKDGSVTLEELEAHLRQRMTTLGKDHADYPSYVKQVAEVKNAIGARNFRREVVAAQENYLAKSEKDPTAAKREYRTVLTGLLSRAKDPNAQKEISGQIKTITEQIEKDRVLADAREVEQAVAKFVAREQTETPVLELLARKAREALTPQEAAKFRDLAIKVDAMAQTRAKVATAGSAGRSSRGGSGGSGASTTAVRAALLDEKNDLDEAVRLVDSLIDKGTVQGPEFETAWALYDRSIGDYKGALSESLGRAGAKAASDLMRDRRSAESRMDTLRKSVGSALVSKANRLDEEFRKAEAVVKAGDKTDYEALAQLRYEWATQLKSLAASPFMGTGQQESIESKIKRGPVALMGQDVAKQDSIVKYGSPKVTDNELLTVYNNYRKEFASVFGGKAEPKSQQDFELALDRGRSPDERDSAGGALPDPRDHTALQAYLFGAGVPKVADPKWGPDRVEEFWQKATQYAERTQKVQEDALAALSALSKDRSPAAVRNRAYWEPGGYLDEGSRAARLSLFGRQEASSGMRPTSPQVEMPSFAADPMAPPPDAGLPADIAPPTEAVGPEMPTEFETPQSSPQSSPQDLWGAGGFLDESERLERIFKVHDSALRALETPVDIELPNFELPSLFDEPAFIRRSQSEYEMPAPPSPRRDETSLRPPPDIDMPVAPGGGGRPTLF